MLSERLKEWALSYEAQGAQKGRQEGRQEGEAFALQHLLARRFGAIPPEMVARIAGAPREEIERWLDRVLDARSLDDIFGSSTH